MTRRRFSQLDVFSSAAFSGNPLAVVVDADGLSTEEMHRFARWADLSESSFLLAPTVPEADYRVRIFTVPKELPFAGHPTLGSCQAWLNAGGRPKTPGTIIQECGAGLIEIRQDGDKLAFAAPSVTRSGPVEEAYVETLAGILGLERAEIVDAQWGDNGPGWVILLLKSAERVLSVAKPSDPIFELDVGLVGPYPKDSECAFEVRAFFADGTGAVVEDPVTGSLNASIAQWLLASGRAQAPYVASQGTAMGRRGRVSVSEDGQGRIWVGGASVAAIEGFIDIGSAQLA